MIFNIHSTDEARDTLYRFTSIPFSDWEKEDKFYHDYEYCDKFLKVTIRKYGNNLPRFEDIDFVISHITTSGNSCQSIRDKGLTDLVSAYSAKDSELRMFIEQHGIDIWLDRKCLKYGDRYFDISFGNPPNSWKTEAYRAWLVGRKFYYDSWINGFLQISPSDVYLGNVHRRPEILKNIDDLLGLRLSEEWAQAHSTYEVRAKVSWNNIVCTSGQPTSEGKALSYLSWAYNAAYGGKSSIVVMLKEGIRIPAQDIISVKPFTTWNKSSIKAGAK